MLRPSMHARIRTVSAVRTEEGKVQTSVNRQRVLLYYGPIALCTLSSGAQCRTGRVLPWYLHLCTVTQWPAAAPFHRFPLLCSTTRL